MTVDDAAESDGATWCWGIFFENDDKKVLFMAANQGRMEAQVLELLRSLGQVPELAWASPHHPQSTWHTSLGR